MNDATASSEDPTGAAGRPVPSWAEPGPHPAAAGVHRIPLPMPTDGLVAVNIYAIEDGDRLVLIDGGWAIPEARAELDRALAALDADVRAVSRILVTHVHRDHYTLAVQLRREVGVRVGLGAGEKPTIDILKAHVAGTGMPGRAELLQAAGAADLAEELRRSSAGEGSDASAWDTPDEWLEPGRIELAERALSAVHTPGHTQGHLVFHDEEAGILFAGDHVLPHITPSIGFEATRPPDPLQDFLDSLLLLRRGPDAILLPAHGEPGQGVHARIDELLAHHEARLAEMEAVVEAEGDVTAADVARAVGWTRRHRAFADLDVLNRMLAVSETVAHLTVLTAQGRVRASEDEVIRYTRRTPPPD
jgi:glyoxylase-like metal-dependent hydrolase (beta-lactamase superfamily II)